MIQLNSSIETLSKTSEHLTGEIRKLMQAQALDSQADLDSLLAAKTNTEEQLSQFGQREDQINEALLVVSSKLTELGKAASELQSEQSIMTAQRNRIALSITRLNEQLRIALSGKCPTCGQLLHDESIAARLSNEISDMTSRLEPEEATAARSDKVANINARIDRIRPAKEKLESDLRSIRSLTRKLRDIKDDIADLQKDRPDYASLIKVHHDAIQRNNAEITVTEASVVEARAQYSCIKWIYGTLLKRNGLLIQSLNKRTKELLQEQIDLIMEDSEFRISIDDDLSVSASFLGRDSGSYKMLSKGQERISDFVMMIAHSNLFTMIHGLDEGVLGLAAFDEVLSFLDDEYIDFAFDCLNHLKVSKRIMISHDTRLISRFDHRINVSLTGKGNSVYVKSWQ
jgi:DNA repair exonuclease SbcCD ATPase subunit